MRILAISGSLRAGSVNSLVLAAVRAAAGAGIEVTFYEGLAELPHFNSDLDADQPPAAVRALREAVRTADAVLISSPEYAHGVPGSLKNALDWTVSSGEFVDKPVGLINAAPRATHAQASLAETLSTMMARLTPDAAVTLPIVGTPTSVDQLTAEPAIIALLHQAIAALVAAAGEPAPTR